MYLLQKKKMGGSPFQKSRGFKGGWEKTPPLVWNGAPPPVWDPQKGKGNSGKGVPRALWENLGKTGSRPSGSPWGKKTPKPGTREPRGPPPPGVKGTAGKKWEAKPWNGNQGTTPGPAQVVEKKNQGSGTWKLGNIPRENGNHKDHHHRRGTTQWTTRNQNSSCPSAKQSSFD